MGTFSINSLIYNFNVKDQIIPIPKNFLLNPVLSTPFIQPIYLTFIPSFWNNFNFAKVNTFLSRWLEFPAVGDAINSPKSMTTSLLVWLSYTGFSMK